VTSDEKAMVMVTWNDISEYVASGNLDSVSINEDMDSATVNVVYMGGRSNEPVKERHIVLNCSGLCYFDLRRSRDHEPGPAMILEAYLRIESELITALRTHKLDSKADCLCLENEPIVYHLELIGEASLNVLCNMVTIESGPEISIER